MIFSELYSAYYNTIAEIISKIIDGEHSEKELQHIVVQHAFGESVLTILPALKNEKWQLIHTDMTTALEHKPSMPLTNLQKQWLKAISLDSRIKLFDVDFEGLEDTEPLFTSNDYCIYDKYSDGDPFEDEKYISTFRFLLQCIRERIPVKIEFAAKQGANICTQCVPVCLEYSEKDDKFRLITQGCRFVSTVNLSKIITCSKYNGDQKFILDKRVAQYNTVTLQIKDERNALERAMLHFAHFEKRVEKLDKNYYSVHIKYNNSDETEIVIRVLSFGPLVKVTEPQSFIELIKDRLIRQKNCNLK